MQSIAAQYIARLSTIFKQIFYIFPVSILYLLRRLHIVEW
jgi:hypothetical protein